MRSNGGGCERSKYGFGRSRARPRDFPLKLIELIEHGKMTELHGQGGLVVGSF
jgi:hypothetical protein